MFRDSKLSTRIILSFLLLFTLFGLAEFNGYRGLARVIDRADKSDQMQLMVKELLESRRNEKNLLIRGETGYREKVLASLAEIRRMAKANKARFAEEQNRRLMEDVLVAVDDYQNAFTRLADTLKGGDLPKAQREELDARMVAAARKAQEACEAAMKDQREEMSEAVHDIRRDFVLFLVLALLLGGGAALLLSHSLIRSFGRIMQSAGRVADGNLAIDRLPESGNEVGRLGKAFNGMIDNVSNVAHNVTGTAAKVSVSAYHIHHAADQVTQTSGKVAAEAGRVAEAAKAVATSSGEIARSCQLAAEGAQHASSSAENGAAVVSRTVQLMGEIAETVGRSSRTVTTLGDESNRIGTIIETIKEIADQTNLLALNAAIEAARAGEQGRGFAVVADEVRALAGRTTKATAEISAMIQNIQKETGVAVHAMGEGMAQVQAGTAEAALSGDALREILAQIKAVSSQVNEIATAAADQTARTGEISGNIDSIIATVEVTAEAAQASATASSQMNAIAEELMSGIGRFQIRESARLAINKAKSAHMIFIGRIKAHLNGTARVDANALPTHLTCAFGKWYQSAGRDQFGGDPVFREIDHHHAEVHSLGKRAVESWDAGRHEEACAACKQMEASSMQLVDLLDKLLAAMPASA